MSDEHATTPLPSKSVLDDVVDLRRYFHKNPEVSFSEHETTRYLKERLRELGLNTGGEFERSLGRRLVESLPDA